MSMVPPVEQIEAIGILTTFATATSVITLILAIIGLVVVLRIEEKVDLLRSELARTTPDMFLPGIQADPEPEQGPVEEWDWINDPDGWKRR